MLAFMVTLVLTWVSHALVQQVHFPLDGKQVADLSSIHLEKVEPNKKGLVVVFLSAKCPCSNSHIQELKNLVNEHKDFSFIAVHSNSDESPDLAKTYFASVHLPFPVVQDFNSKWADLFGANKTPHAFVVTPSGQIVYQGGVTSSNNAPTADQRYLHEALEDVSKGRAVKTPLGRTLGCAITREGNKNVW